MWIVLAFSAVLAGGGLALPRLHPIPADTAQELTALRDELNALAGNDDATLAQLRVQAKATPTWSMERFTTRIERGWQVEWQQNDGANRTVLIRRANPRLEEWPEYRRFAQTWTEQFGVVLDSLDFTAEGAGPNRRFTAIVIGLRVRLTARETRDAQRDAPNRVPLPVAPADAAAPAQNAGPGPPLRPASASGPTRPSGSPGR
jgi:hypothetical protein